MCVWVEDADKLDFNSQELNLVFMNRSIKSYLDEMSNLGLSGVKGQGKTFLIKVKRKKVQSDPSVICLPYNRMVDIVDSSITIHRSLYSYLRDYNIWVNMWKFSICSAIITCPPILDQFSQKELHLKKETKDFVFASNPNSEPSFYLTKLLHADVNTLMALLEDTDRVFDCAKNLHQSICVFFDKMDQGFSAYAKNFNSDTSSFPARSRNASFWQFAQYSLAEAAYDIYNNTGHHIKVFYTIRQEALIDSELLNKDKVRNINGYITNLLYTKKNLEEMYEMYIRNENDNNLADASAKGRQPSKAFVGTDTLAHGYIPNATETIFDYIYRHSFKRPYDIQKICRKLYFAEATQERDIRHIVNSASNELMSMYLHELETFLPCSIDEIERLIRMIPGNILNLDLMKCICDTFNLENSKDESWQCNQRCTTCKSLQPFSILYNLGLIGFLQQHAADATPFQTFQNIGKSILELNMHALPASDFYFLHPSLSNKARDERCNLGLTFNTNSFLLIGDQCSWDSENQELAQCFVQNCKEVAQSERVFVSSTIHDLDSEREAIRSYLKQRGLHPIMSEHHEFDISQTQFSHSHDHCLDEILKCKSLIFLIGTEYGGEYQGKKYMRQKEEITKLSRGKIENPSISLMEYYLARTQDLTCYAFTCCEMDDPIFKGSLSQDLRNEINFLTHFSRDGVNIVGNWVTRYNSVDDLLLHIKNLKFG